MSLQWIYSIKGVPLKFYYPATMTPVDLFGISSLDGITDPYDMYGFTISGGVVDGDNLINLPYGGFSYDIPDTNLKFAYNFNGLGKSWSFEIVGTSAMWSTYANDAFTKIGFIGVFDTENNKALIGNYDYSDRYANNVYFRVLYVNNSIFEEIPPNIPSTDYTLFIDGERLPNYNLNWNPNGLGEFSKDADVYIEFSCLSRSPIDPAYEHFIIKSSPYTDGSIKFNWSQIWQEIDAQLNVIDSIINNKFKVEINAVFDNSKYHIVKEKVSVELYEKKNLLGELYENLVTPSASGDTLAIDFGEGKDTDDYYDTDSGENDEHSPTNGYDIGACNLTTCYELSVERLNNIAIKLWSEDFFSNILLLNNSPIENILSCKLLPLSLNGSESTVKIGNVDMGINGNRLSKTVYRYNIGTITIPRVSNMGFLNYAPYTSIVIFLPFIGFKELNTSDIMGRNISVDYIVDVITGACKAIITVNNYQCYEFDGNCGIDIPLTAGNRSQVEMGYVKSAVGVVSNIASKNIGGAISSGISGAMQQYHYSTNGSYSPATGAYEDRTCFVIIDRPQYTEVSKFGHTKGYKCQLSKTIGSLKGFVKTTENVDLSNISAPEYCKKKILDLLSSGIYV